ncbi:NUDIX hydrolase [Pseudomonas sp. 5P_3.1_Bac2]|uniref:NUDIX hydrolase n=1 Tax=Pseudomonas sp. 5P_3.1_Bac2 TaxID=2971617 RepID=UPI0021C801BE|nr:NUDIX domain-containing protein [Pseudomonas sp. 5P_3.1_Bac2]MCU1718237.1 NUDIX domain-containing protein [Pseudomonas sp. 5P_3.1_Bac2]
MDPWSAAEAVHRAASDAELVAWVDEQDRPLGALSRQELRERHLIGRCTYILLFNRAGQLCVHQRTLSKALYPGYWDVAAGGMVAAGEDYLSCAQRELAEELGISDALLEPCGQFFYDGAESRLWGRVYRAVSDSPLQLQREEVLQARFIELDQVMRDAQQHDYCPDSLRALQEFLQQRGA